jgi:hypothetical protein
VQDARRGECSGIWWKRSWQKQADIKILNGYCQLKCYNTLQPPDEDILHIPSLQSAIGEYTFTALTLNCKEV